MREPAASHPDEYWDKVMEVNLNAQFVLTREFGKDMIEGGSGKDVIFGGGGTAGQKYDTVADWKGVVQLASLDDKYAVVVTEDNGSLNLKTVAYP